MIPYERQHKIMELLNREKYVSVNAAVDLLDIPKSTLRRDILELEANNLLSRTRGGISLPPTNSVSVRSGNHPLIYGRPSENVDEKARIAAVAASFIHPNDTVFLDSGTTTFELAKILKDYEQPLVVASNDLSSSMVLSENSTIDTIVIGGKINSKNYAMNGYFSDSIISQIHANLAFLAADAVNIQKGLMVSSLENVTGKKAIIDSAGSVIALCDHLKFSRSSFITFCAFDDIDIIITGREIDEDTQKKLEDKGVEVILA